MTTEILAPEPKNAIAAYTPFYADLAKMEAENKATVFDYESKKGNKEARSHIFKLRKAKASLDRVRKEQKAEYLEKGRAVDSEASEIGSRIEAMIEVHQVKIDEIEKREADRISAVEQRVASLASIQFEADVSALKARIAELEQTAIDDSWDEFTTDAAKAKDASIAKHRELLAAKEKVEAEAAELARLKAEAAAREQQDRDAAIATAAEEKARADAELAAQRERERVQAERDAAERKAKEEREAGERRELELKLQAEAAERRRVEAEQRAEQDKKEAAERAERMRLQAIRDEQDRVAAHEAEVERQRVAREADKIHRRDINRAAVQTLLATGITEKQAQAVVTLIAHKQVPAISIFY